MRSRTMLPFIGALALAVACGDTSQLDSAFGPNSVPDGTIVLEQSRFEGDAGDTASLRAFVLDRRGRRFQLEELSWESADSSIAVVDSSGQLFLVQPGETQLTVTFRGTRLAASARASNRVTISKVDVFPEPLNLTVGDEQGLGLYIRYSNGNTIRNKLGANWSSSDPSVVRVTGWGRISALKAGTSRIIAKRGKFADTVTVTVAANQEAKPAPTLSIAPDTGQVRVAETFSFSTALSSGEKNPSGVTWTVTDPSVASISASGVLTGKKAGYTSVRATRDGKSVAAVLRVAAAPKIEAPPTEPEKKEPEKQEPQPKEDNADNSGSGNGPSSTPPASTPPPPPPPPPPASGSSIATTPELPRVYLDTRMPAVTGRTIVAPDGASFQRALDDARPGDEIVLNAGTTYRGPFTLRKKSGNGWITIRSSRLSSLPAEGVRVTPSNASSMPQLVTTGSNEPVIKVEKGAGYYRLAGLEITAPSSVTGINALIYLHVSGASSASDLAHNIVVDRSWVHGHATMQLTRCIIMNAASSAVVDSYLSDCHAKGQDSQAIVAWQTPGPLKIVNNHLEGAGENILFGGASAGLQGVTPSDIEIRRNYFYKPLSWHSSGRWSVKNLFEIKFAQRVLLEGNVFENNWADGQTGSAILIKADNQDSSPWVRTQDITIRYNIIKNTPSAVNLAALRHVPTARVRFEHNIMIDVGVRSLGTLGRIVQLLGRMEDIAFEHNTLLFTTGNRAANSAFTMDGNSAKRLSIVNNVIELGPYGVKAGGAATGASSLNAYADSWRFAGNVLIGTGNSSVYPAGNTMIGSVGALGYLNAAVGDLRLSSGSPLRQGGGAPAGADAERVNQAVQGVVKR